MSNNFVHIELNSGDVAAAKKFYKKLFTEWSMNDQEMGGGMVYTLLSEGKKGLGGMTANMPGVSTGWLPYVEVKDVKKTLAAAEKSGGKIVVQHTPIGEMGAIGVFKDPTGATLGIWESNAKPELSKAEKKAAKAARKAEKKAAKEAAKAAKAAAKAEKKAKKTKKK